MSGLSDSELDYLEEAMDDQRAYAEDQRRMLDEAEAIVAQLQLCELITKREADTLRYFIR